MKKYFFLLFVTPFFSCASLKILNHFGKETAEPTHFKTKVPFILDNGCIYVNTIVANNGTVRVLQLDNHAPTSLLSKPIDNTPSMTRLGTFFLDRPVADGGKIKNIIYLADSLRLGGVLFKKVMVNKIPDYFKDDPVIKYHDGLLGTNIFLKGVWKIDFENKILTVASSIDSIEDLKYARKISAKFTDKNLIKIKIDFPFNITETAEMDLGADMDIIVSKKTIEKVDVENYRRKIKSDFMSVKGITTTNFYFLKNQTIKIDNNPYMATIYSNDLVNASFIGVGFFSRFKFIIIDYTDKNLYLSKDTRYLKSGE